MDPAETNAMEGINSYGKELTQEDIEKGRHREFVGGLWEEIGELQFAFLKERGLKSSHKLLDIGCGCLRGGLRFVEYLDESNYGGLDVNRSLIEAGMRELDKAGLAHKRPMLLVDDRFRLERFGMQFDYILSVSLFTHLPMNAIVRCLSEARKHLKPDGIYFSTFFEAPGPAHLKNLVHQPGGVVTNYDADPFHYAFSELAWTADIAGLKALPIGEWNHPRAQRMIAFQHPRIA